MSTVAELLDRHRPVLRYDSQESYFADSAAVWTDNPGNRLTTAAGALLAQAGDRLSLAFLGPEYPDGRGAADGDVIGNPAKRYREQARALHQRPGYANRMYGHGVTDRAHNLWLQYWFFYFYNDYNLIGHIIRAGLHEGDWEMIQVCVGRDETPTRATYAQHAGASEREWSRVERKEHGRRPVVYVARGSHAGYFTKGTHWTGHWFDHADGGRHTPELTLEIAAEGDPAWRWIHWPGRWGDTRNTGGNPLNSDSPPGPAAHPRWNDPLLLAERAAAPAPPTGAPRVPPPVPTVRAGWEDGHIRVEYAAPPALGGTQPSGLVLTINSRGERAPPTTQAVPIGVPMGTVDVPFDVDPSLRYDIHVSSATPDGLASESACIDLAAAV
jgi:hypothetical protein